MAHREMRKSRVLVAAAGLFVGLLCLWARVAWLQLGMHDHFTRRAAENQIERRPIVPHRGLLLDRQGRPLARDLHTSEIAIYRPQLASAKIAAAKLAPVLGVDRRRLERRIAGMHGYSWLAHDVPPEIGERVQALELEGVVVKDETARDYRLGAAAAEVLGRTNRDNVGVDGLEYQWDETLAGQSGWTTLVRDGRGRAIRLPGAAGRAAKHGDHLVLSIDADLQGIVEAHLARAVDTLRAKRGFAIFLDPSTGEILASACVPHLPPGQAKNWTLTDQYEPGSTFKAVVAGAMLEEGLARPQDVFPASSTGMAELLPGCVFHDTHKAVSYSFFRAVQLSSNIVCGRLAMRLGAERLYRYATALGFGSLTGIAFPGETAGRLRPPTAWQPRSTPTIAIGYEVTVTPLQLALAYAAIANGGVLMEPLLVREVRAADGHTLRRWTPQASHRVFRERTTEQLREMLTAVVDSGTATAAYVRDVRIAGKTGTAKKYHAAVGGYGAGMYIASFAGFVPADHPRLVGVVVIDEPGGNLYYGGQCAAPVFREVVMDLMRLPNGLLGPAPAPVAGPPPVLAAVTAPDLRLLPPREAERRLRDYGLRARFEGQGARVLGQSPPAGEAVERGGTVTAWLSSPQDSAGRVLPDLVGLSVREALRRLSSRQVTARISGRGIVVRQEPVAGTSLPIAGPCRLWCEADAPPSAVAPTAAALLASASRKPGP